MVIFWLVLVISTQSTTFNFTQFTQSIHQPLFAQQITMGKTVNNNSLNVYFVTKIKFKDIFELQGKNAILINSLMHAREPYSIQLMSELFKRIVSDGYKSELDYFFSNGVFIFYPFVNADGYQLTLKNSDIQARSQVRKNSNTNNINCRGGLLAGVDINRNFPSSFGTVDTSNYPCSQQYHGVAPFSQQQSFVFKNIFMKFKVLIAIDIHSYGNDWIYPYASDASGQKVKRHQLYPFYQLVKKGLKARKRRILSCIESLNYIADGVYIDWALDNNALSFVFEVGKTFHSDPKDNISQDIRQAIIDCYLIFQMTDMDYSTTVLADSLLITSQSLVNMTLIIKTKDQQLQQQLIVGSQISIKIKDSNTNANIKIKQNGKTRIISLKPSLLIDSVSIISIIIVAIVSIFCCFYIRRKQSEQTKRQQIKQFQMSLEQISTIVEASQI